MLPYKRSHDTACTTIELQTKPLTIILNMILATNQQKIFLHIFTLKNNKIILEKFFINNYQDTGRLQQFNRKLANNKDSIFYNNINLYPQVIKGLTTTIYCWPA